MACAASARILWGAPHGLPGAQVVEMMAPEFQGIPFPSGWDAMYPPGAQPMGEEGAYEHRAHLVGAAPVLPVPRRSLLTGLLH